MKQLFLTTLAFLVFASGFAQTTPEPASIVLASAKEQAGREKKNIILIFHASWCGWCHKMDSSLNDPKVKKYFQDNYVFRHLVVNEFKDKKKLENPGAQEMMEQFGGTSTEGIPYWAVLDAKGNLLADSRIDSQPGKNSGCPAKKEEVDYFIKVLQKTSKLDANALDVIGKRFRENEL
ncbi:thioredoxin family protein [Chitinophagaceae bacterium LB-8]|uniref:Thioredoxin family protein n=1 Tax=Paraflavisolibacter caeni TaxID=2982496 RepID=A0A9X3BGY2_9BACT|nr:thioredoxin family protein [Paraflavisolibacter caeni]MCU7548602.1 thioredoxin family protein [Paraflavisolibacter caeni]